MRLAIEERGSGPRRVALVHGILGSGAIWTDTVEASDLSEFTFLLVDLRGHGASPRADRSTGERYDVRSMAKDLVDSLPEGLDAVVGHSLGGTLLHAAVADLRPARAIYLDPGFRLLLPGRGVLADLFWRIPNIGRLLARAYDRTDPATGPANVTIARSAHRAFDQSMIPGLLRDIAAHPVHPAPPAVPSTIVLSDDGRLVVPSRDVPSFSAEGWDIVRARGIRHDMMLLDGARTALVIGAHA